MRPIPELTNADIARFWDKVDKSGDCWLWTAGLSVDGYGQFWLGGYQMRANRISYAMVEGDPGSRHVCHKCDNRRCVNPEHLWVGTNKDNMVDRDEKQRMARGSLQGLAVLTEKRVLEIVVSDESALALAERHGCSRRTIYDIRLGNSWNHVTNLPRRKP